MAEGTGATATQEEVMGEALRRDGRRLTAQRALLLRIIEGADEHLDAEGIHRRAQEQGARMSLSTVYRTLKVLAGMGLLRELHFDEEHHHFERALGEHYHLYCLECGEVTEYWPPDGGRRLREVAGQCDFDLVSARLELQGFCQRCRGGRREQERGKGDEDDCAARDLPS